MSRSLKRSCSPVPCISRKARRLSEPATDLEAYFAGWSSDLPIFKLEPIDVPELLLSAFDTAPSATAALPPFDLAASTSITTPPASASTDLPNAIDPLASPTDPKSELPSVTTAGSASTLTVSAATEAATTGPTTDLLLAPGPAAVHTEPLLAVPATPEPPLDVPATPEAAHDVNGPRFQAKNSAFCIIGGDHGDDDDNTWARLERCDLVPNQLPNKKLENMDKIMSYRSRVGSLEPMVYHEGYRKTTEKLGIFKSHEFKNRDELLAMVAQKGLIMKKSESKGGAPSKKQQLKWKTCDLCNNIMYDDEKTLDRHCNSRGHTRFLACVIDTPLPVCGWKCPLCNALMRTDRRSNHPSECNKGTKPTHWTCNVCLEHIPRGQKAQHRKTCEPAPARKPKSSGKARRASRGLEENAGPATPPHVPRSTHHVDMTEHFAPNDDATQLICETILNRMQDPIPEGALPFPDGVPDMGDHGDLSMSRLSGYAQPMLGTSMSGTLISSSRHNVTRMVMPSQDHWDLACAPGLTYGAQVDTFYAQGAYDYSLEPAMYHSQMPQQQPQPQPQISYSESLLFELGLPH